MTYHIYDEKGKKVGELPDDEMLANNQGCIGCINLIIIIAIFIWLYKGCKWEERMQKQIEKSRCENTKLE